MPDAPPFCWQPPPECDGGGCEGAVMVPFHRLALGEDL